MKQEITFNQKIEQDDDREYPKNIFTEYSLEDVNTQNDFARNDGEISIQINVIERLYYLTETDFHTEYSAAAKDSLAEYEDKYGPTIHGRQAEVLFQEIAALYKQQMAIHDNEYDMEWNHDLTRRFFKICRNQINVYEVKPTNKPAEKPLAVEAFIKIGNRINNALRSVFNKQI
jgi:hypothetical protein